MMVIRVTLNKDLEAKQDLLTLALPVVELEVKTDLNVAVSEIN